MSGRRRLWQGLLGRCSLLAGGGRSPHSSAAEVSSRPSPETRLFNKLLVADHGETAVRILRTAKRLGIPSVAIYTDADNTALHARYADEAVCVGPGPATKSYRDIKCIVDAISQAGADAVHPGYGALSVNPEFVQAMEEAGAAFVGPPASAVLAMQHNNEVHEASDKADWKTASVPLEGQGSMLKLTGHPQRLGIQVLGDKHGNTVFFPETWCSLQAGKHEVICEAPCPTVAHDMRMAMGEQAVRVAREAGYHSLGTCVFSIDQSHKFHFLRIEPAMQAGYALTEVLSGQDLVEHQLRVAAGEPLRLTQEQALAFKGCAMECRIYAEERMAGTAIMKRYQKPRGLGVRVDSGVVEGSKVCVSEDTLVSRVVTHGLERAQAQQRMARALDTYVIRGVQHNVPLLRSLLDTPGFSAGNLPTDRLAQHSPTPETLAPHTLPLSRQQEGEVAALAAVLHVERELRLRQQPTLQEDELLVLRLSPKDTAFHVTVRPASPAMVAPKPGALPAYEVQLADRVLQVEPTRNQAGILLEADIDGSGVCCQVIKWRPRHYLLQYCGAHRNVTIYSPAAAALAAAVA